MKDGLFIVLEGIEGAGKSTQARLLGNWLEELGLPFMAVDHRNEGHGPLPGGHLVVFTGPVDTQHMLLCRIAV